MTSVICFLKNESKLRIVAVISTMMFQTLVYIYIRSINMYIFVSIIQLPEQVKIILSISLNSKNGWSSILKVFTAQWSITKQESTQKANRWLWKQPRRRVERWETTSQTSRTMKVQLMGHINHFIINFDIYIHINIFIYKNIYIHIYILFTGVKMLLYLWLIYFI